MSNPEGYLGEPHAPDVTALPTMLGTAIVIISPLMRLDCRNVTRRPCDITYLAEASDGNMHFLSSISHYATYTSVPALSLTEHFLLL